MRTGFAIHLKRLIRLLVGGVAILGITYGSEILTRVSDIRLLTREKAEQEIPVKIRGVVTWVDGRSNLTVQDETGGIWVSVGSARMRGILKGNIRLLGGILEGNEIEIEGIARPGGYAPLVMPTSIRVLGKRPLPAAPPMRPNRFFSGADDCQRIEVHAVVQGFIKGEHDVTLIMDAEPGRFIATVSPLLAGDPESLVDAEVRLRGVAATLFNTRGEVTGSRMLANIPEDLLVKTPPPAPDRIPRVTMDRLLPFRAEPIGPHRVRIEGTVTYSLKGKFFYLQDGPHAVRVETNSNIILEPGERVEATGFVNMARMIGTLSDSTVRKTGVAEIPKPVEITPEEIFALNEKAVDLGLVANPHDYDGHLIRCRARLLAVQSEPDGKTLRALTLERRNTLGNGTLVFRALFDDAQMKSLENLRPGSDLELTGLVRLDYGVNELTRKPPVNLDLILRSPADVVLLKEPSWWSIRKLGLLLAAVVAALGVALLWSLQLKRQVNRKTMLLAREMRARRDASIEFQATLRERTRLATNLHDTLLQTISGLGFQIEACEGEADSPRTDRPSPGHLEVARRMIDHAATELRNSVWALRSLPLNGMELPEALNAVARRLGAGRSTKIDVHADGELSRVPDFIAGNLLLFVQEAVHNALKHGMPKTVSIKAKLIEINQRISLTVLDDGSGFTLGSEAGVSSGHFGLQGMRERIERLDGVFKIESAPGNGTTVTAQVPLRIYDSEITDTPPSEDREEP